MSGTINLELEKGDCQISFLGQGGFTLSKLMPLTDEILSRQPDIVYIEIGRIEFCIVEPFVLADKVFHYAEMLASRGIRRMII